MARTKRIEMGDNKEAVSMAKEIEAFTRLTKCKEGLEPALVAFVTLLESKVEEAIAKRQVM